MSLSVTSAPSFLRLALGEVKEVAFTIESTLSLTGETLRIYPEFFGSHSNIPQFYPSVGYWSIVYPGAGTIAATWNGAAQYQNLSLELVRTSDTIFVLNLDLLIGIDAYESGGELVPTEVLDGIVEIPSLYDTNRFLNLFVYVESNIQNRVSAFVEVIGTLPKVLGEDSFQVSLKVDGMVASNPKDGKDVTVNFQLAKAGGSLEYEIIIFKDRICAQGGAPVDSIQTQLALQGATTVGPAALPSLVDTNITPTTLVLNGVTGLYEGSFVIDAAWLEPICGQSFIIRVTDGAVFPTTFKYTLFTQLDLVPDPTVVVSSIIDGNLYTTSCVTNVPACFYMGFQVAMDTASYDTQIGALGLSGNYVDNIVDIRVYVLDHEPVEDEDLSGFVSERPLLTPFLLGTSQFYHQFAEGSTGITFVVFDYIFTEHSLRIPFRVLHPFLANFDTITFKDELDVVLNSACADFSGGLKVLMEHSDPITDANAFNYNSIKLYSNGLEVPSVIKSSALTDDEAEVVFEVDEIEPGQCFCAALAVLPAASEAVGACLDNSIVFTQSTSSAGRFSITLEHTVGAGFLNPSNYLVIRKAGEVVDAYTFSNDWTGPAQAFLFNVPFQGVNQFTYELFIYTEDGCAYSGMSTLLTTDEIADSVFELVVMTA